MDGENDTISKTNASGSTWMRRATKLVFALAISLFLMAVIFPMFNGELGWLSLGIIVFFVPTILIVGLILWFLSRPRKDKKTVT